MACDGKFVNEVSWQKSKYFKLGFLVKAECRSCDGKCIKFHEGMENKFKSNDWNWGFWLWLDKQKQYHKLCAMCGPYRMLCCNFISSFSLMQCLLYESKRHKLLMCCNTKTQYALQHLSFLSAKFQLDMIETVIVVVGKWKSQQKN